MRLPLIIQTKEKLAVPEFRRSSAAVVLFTDKSLVTLKFGMPLFTIG